MPTNKNAKFRIDLIDECLRNTSKKWSKTDLLEYVNRRLALHFGDGTRVSPSQLRYDLAHMQCEFGAPIEMYREGRGHYYRYESPDFSIKNISLTEQELDTLKRAVCELSLVNSELAIEMSTIVYKLQAKSMIPGDGKN